MELLYILYCVSVPLLSCNILLHFASGCFYSSSFFVCCVFGTLSSVTSNSWFGRHSWISFVCVLHRHMHNFYLDGACWGAEGVTIQGVSPAVGGVCREENIWVFSLIMVFWWNLNIIRFTENKLLVMFASVLCPELVYLVQLHHMPVINWELNHFQLVFLDIAALFV